MMKSEKRKVAQRKGKSKTLGVLRDLIDIRAASCMASTLH